MERGKSRGVRSGGPTERCPILSSRRAESTPARDDGRRHCHEQGPGQCSRRCARTHRDVCRRGDAALAGRCRLGRCEGGTGSAAGLRSRVPWRPATRVCGTQARLRPRGTAGLRSRLHNWGTANRSGVFPGGTFQDGTRSAGQWRARAFPIRPIQRFVSCVGRCGGWAHGPSGHLAFAADERTRDGGAIGVRWQLRQRDRGAYAAGHPSPRSRTRRRLWFPPIRVRHERRSRKPCPPEGRCGRIPFVDPRGLDQPAERSPGTNR